MFHFFTMTLPPTMVGLRVVRLGAPENVMVPEPEVTEHVPVEGFYLRSG